MIDVDVQPNYVRVCVKDNIFQLGLNDEVNIEASTSQRSIVTGNLLITMPKLNYKEVLPVKVQSKQEDRTKKRELSSVVDHKNIVKINDGTSDKIAKNENINYDDMPELI